ncbi:hypothetical protein BOTNAR_0540g00050 [Botryotinia narcissicola]|uniref:Haloacid dehalogenase n=1 Tax=Botryotinia narcissicola TaxID=278944 RepID=A0A4Z1HDX3_9HELO|nr:hypothetical protein BOTNAR_0540g00050 [Botryotinia narcissicola]
MAGKVDPNDPRKLTDFKLLSFDVYSTLIDEKGGLFTGLHPLLSRLPEPLKSNYFDSRASTLQAFQTHEHQLQRTHPTLLYPSILHLAYLSYAQSLPLTPPPSLSTLESEAQEFSQKIPSWPAFPDTVSALQKLHKYYKLVILSNINEESIEGTIRNNMDVGWDAVYTAQKIGSYKPDLRNFEFLIEHVGEDLGVGKEEILHTAQSLRADHVPVKKMNMTGVWIDRGNEGQDYEKLKDEVAYTWKFSTLGEMADAVEEAFEAQGKKV